MRFDCTSILQDPIARHCMPSRNPLPRFNIRDNNEKIHTRSARSTEAFSLVSKVAKSNISTFSGLLMY